MLKCHKGLLVTLILLILSSMSLLGCGKTESKTPTVENDSGTNSQIKQLRADVQKCLELLNEIKPEVQEDDLTFEFHTTEEASKKISDLGEQPSAIKLATVLVEIDAWLVMPEEEAKFMEFKNEQIKALRKQISKEVTTLQNNALKALSKNESLKFHSQAAQVLALFPITDDPEIIQQAATLSRKQSEVLARLRNIQHLRYNSWATKQVEAAINDYNKKSSYWSPKKENPLLIESLVKNLGQVEPRLLEPVVLELYNYVINLTEQSISENDKLNLAKRMSSPDIKRKLLGDF